MGERTITTEIDTDQIISHMQGLIRVTSTQLSEARKIIAMLTEERDLLKAKVGSLTSRLEEFQVDNVSGLSPLALLNPFLHRSLAMINRRNHQPPSTNGKLHDAAVISALVFDVDQFSVINDQYGTAYGDHILGFVGGAISRRIRAVDFAARKGQRFIVILPECSGHDAVMKAREIMNRVADFNFGDLEKPIHITLTVGICVYNDKMKIEDLVSKAEVAMHVGKSNGRYCSVVYRDSENGGCQIADRFVANNEATGNGHPVDKP